MEGLVKLVLNDQFDVGVGFLEGVPDNLAFLGRVGAGHVQIVQDAQLDDFIRAGNSHQAEQHEHRDQEGRKTFTHVVWFPPVPYLFLPFGYFGM